MTGSLLLLIVIPLLWTCIGLECTPSFFRCFLHGGKKTAAWTGLGCLLCLVAILFVSEAGTGKHRGTFNIGYHEVSLLLTPSETKEGPHATVTSQEGWNYSQHIGSTELFLNFPQNDLDLLILICGAPTPHLSAGSNCIYRLKAKGKVSARSTSFVWVSCLVSGFCKTDEFCLKASADRQTDLYLLWSI
jgi:hypothetical protein